MRVESSWVCNKGGWFHRLGGPYAGSIREPAAKTSKLTPARLEELHRRYQSAVRSGALATLAANLGVAADALRQLHAGWDGRAWTFPMRDGNGRIIGMHRRFPNGEKKCLSGSRLGLFISNKSPTPGNETPAGAPENRGFVTVTALPEEKNKNTLLICEGASDTAAAITAGYDAIGLPGVGMCFDNVVRIVQREGRDSVVVVADLDDAKPLPSGYVNFPGIESALKLAERLMPVVHDLRFLLPPDGYKDIRAWLKAGGDAVQMIAAAVTAAPQVHPAWINRARESLSRRKDEYRHPSWSRQASALIASIEDSDIRADLRERFEERVAICEIDGNLPTDEAERIAYEQIRQAIENESRNTNA
jgi:hypothetical protein